MSPCTAVPSHHLAPHVPRYWLGIRHSSNAVAASCIAPMYDTTSLVAHSYSLVAKSRHVATEKGTNTT